MDSKTKQYLITIWKDLVGKHLPEKFHGQVLIWVVDKAPVELDIGSIGSVETIISLICLGMELYMYITALIPARLTQAQEPVRHGALRSIP